MRFVILFVFLVSFLMTAQAQDGKIKFPKTTCSTHLSLRMIMFKSMGIPMWRSQRTWKLYMAAERVMNDLFSKDDVKIIAKVQKKINKRRPENFALSLTEVAEIIYIADQERTFCQRTETGIDPLYTKEIIAQLVAQYSFEFEEN